MAAIRAFREPAFGGFRSSRAPRTATLTTVEPLLDRLGRPLETLRVSITDHCNFRCVYCMPKDVFGRDHAFLERRELLSFEEIARVVGVFVGLGVRRCASRAASRSCAGTSSGSSSSSPRSPTWSSR